MITRAEIREHLVRLTSEITSIPPHHIGDTAAIDEELRMESVAFIELQVVLEDHYGIEIDPMRILELNRLAAIVDYLYSEITRSNGAVPCKVERCGGS